jgi:hypothetical protein
MPNRSLRILSPIKAAESGPTPPFSASNSILFDGIDENLQTSLASEFDFDGSLPFSISIWIKPITDSDVWMAKRNNVNHGWALPFFSQQPRFQMIDTGGGQLAIGTSASITLNDWHHVVFTYDGSKSSSGALIYVDGSLVALTNFSDTFTGTMSNSDTVKIGSDRMSSFTDGNIADLSIWNIELNSSQVTSLYNSGTLVDLRLFEFYNTTDAEGWWWMGDFPGDSTAGGGSIGDATTNGHTLTPQNMEAGDIVADVPS